MSGDSHSEHFKKSLEDAALRSLQKAEQRKLRISTAESCTGGLLSALLTDIDGLSHVFDRGYVTYTEEAKSACLKIDCDEIKKHNAVSAHIAQRMANGTLAQSDADIAIAITGFAGPPHNDEEEGLVFIALAARNGQKNLLEKHFGALGRSAIRQLALKEAIDALDQFIERAV